MRPYTFLNISSNRPPTDAGRGLLNYQFTTITIS